PQDVVAERAFKLPGTPTEGNGRRRGICDVVPVGPQGSLGPGSAPPTGACRRPLRVPGGPRRPGPLALPRGAGPGLACHSLAANFIANSTVDTDTERLNA